MKRNATIFRCLLVLSPRKTTWSWAIQWNAQSTQTGNCIDGVSDQLFVGLTLQVWFALNNHNILKENQLWNIYNEIKQPENMNLVKWN